MKHCLLILFALPLFFIAFQNSAEARGAKRYLMKESSVDMANMKSVFIGWMDMAPDDWSIHGYENKAEWISTINQLNNFFQRQCQTKYLPGWTVTGAKDMGDEKPADGNLYIKFSDVKIDYDHYYLYLSIHFIDSKKNAEIAVIPTRAYYGNDWGFERYLRAALDEVAIKVQVEVFGKRLKDK